ncbi:Mus7/MMS22 family-domain-containing protein [Chaetomium tenue]|uniref:Mus7/MMS22 family-domain-containing protein n=1 Tax=Chaetomium tenue TaxID=1854479 RepID=A0ACB7NXD6_9PEZI|nr:Mus7/MMS22 family-domain-containing protein [Chaetomium globosum]
MKSWRELGEVPDSDDESFDDANFNDDNDGDEGDNLDQFTQLPRNDVDDTRVEEKSQDPAKDGDGDIWSVPSSLPEQASPFLATISGQASQMLSQPPWHAQPTADIPERGTPSTPTKSTFDRPASSTPRNRPKLTSDSDLEDEILTGYVPAASPGSGASSPASFLSRTPTPPRFPSLPDIRLTPPVAHPTQSPTREPPSVEETNTQALLNQAEPRRERSFRPRKPIQQHPYLLENAQYATFMKSHGVKPIRVAQSSRPAGSGIEEEDSQEQEFQAEESQEASGGVLGGLEESGPILFDDDEDELTLTPSAPKTSPRGQEIRTSSQQPNGDQTDATSLSDEEFPPLDRLRPVSPKRRQQVSKRQRPQTSSSVKRKRARFIPDSSSQASPQRPTFIQPPPLNVWDLSSSPPTPSPPEEPLRKIRTTPKPPVESRPSTSDTPARDPGLNSAVLEARATNSPILINEDSLSDLSDGDQADSTDSSGSGSDSEVVRQNSRRIRGVLPASWLRIDQQGKPVARNARRRTPQPSPERTARRGVALPRQGFEKPSSAAPLMLFDESEDSENESPRRPIATNDPIPTAPRTIVINEDDGASVIEEDTIDWMLPGRKRSGPQKTSGRAKKQKQSRTQSVFQGRPNPTSRQPRITQVLHRSKQGATPTSAKRNLTKQQRHRERGGSRVDRNTDRKRATPPLLSILDVAEPEAPKFVKIAARAAKRRLNLGKASPSRKLISLATRNDNVDALSVLRDWKSGKTKPKIPTPQRKHLEKPRSRPVLREISTNTTPRPRGGQPRKLVRQSNLDSFVAAEESSQDVQAPQPASTSAIQPRKQIPDRPPSLHPAQLEEEETGDKRRQLNARKRTLDAFYRRHQRILDASADDGSDRVLDMDFTLREPVAEEQGNGAEVGMGVETPSAPTSRNPKVDRSRFRKRRRPQCVDLEAPQYARANDPLPADFSAIEVRERQTQDKTLAEDKLRGLGPYGTHYTHHFEVFPLDRDVYFHESTVIGRGLVRDAVDVSLSDRTRHQRPAVSFPLDGRILRWSTWNDTTSSELGILIDWVTEQLAQGTAASEGFSPKAPEAADFVLGYVLHSLNIPTDSAGKAFVSRWLEILSSFTNRLESTDTSLVSEGAKRAQLGVNIRLSLATLAVRSISQGPNGDPFQSMKLDDLLKKTASITIRHLLSCGTEELRTLYGDLQRSGFRERGIRPDLCLANCWVVMMRLLESAAIPRSSFWDVTQSVMLGREVALGSDAQVFERIWQDVFTLLPLSEIDNSGLLVSGARHVTPVEGWALPQQLLKRVFQLYQANPRQPPGFNDYCRALVARCHFLVQQWGWRKCTGVIGTIFDFFGSQNLAHLRNEEVYKSPQFLEELDRKLSLAIEPEDRCFHIFIKLLALAIQRLKELGRPNDIKNLVTRTLPNHSRQYLREDTIRQHDLAALRNHHDLLCTLFWVSPPELRREVHDIEALVVPGTAHKEACLINVRAWNQLARFVIAKDEGGVVFRPLAVWRNNVFNQVLDQYLSAASDIEQQFRALSTEMPNISKDMRDEMVAKNKATALDVLHFSVKASLDVLQRAPTLEAVLYGLNTGQLQKVFTSLDYQSLGFDWGILRVALDTLEHLMGRIDQASEEQYSSEFDDNINAPFLEDAVLLVNEHLTKDFFWMTRTILALPLEKSPRRHTQQSACAEKAVTLAARIAARFVKNRVTQLLPYFSPGKYSLFPDVPKNLTTPERRFLPLFLAVLVKNHVFDFRDIGINVLGLWVLAVVKPLRYLGYENYLAEVLKHHNLAFLERATVTVGIPPDYNSNIDFFSCAIQYMRKKLREYDSVQARQHRDEFKKTLQLVMQKIKDDLALLRSYPSEHGLYIDFVRQVISLIKSHGVNICTVDPFFMQPSADYSPSIQDPQLHTAGIVAYGVKLSEGDATATQQLFHYLLNNFKVSLGNDKLQQECKILSRAMRNAHVTSFILQHMIPAIIQASAQVPDCWALLEVYTVALGEILDSGCVPKELPNHDVEHAVGILTSILAWVDTLRNTAAFSLPRLHILSLLATIANILQPSLAAYLFNEPDSDSAIPHLQDPIDKIATLFTELRFHIGDTLSLPDGGGTTPTSLTLSSILTALPPRSIPAPGSGGHPRVQTFANFIATDVRQNWVVTADRVMVRMASSGRGSQGGFPMMMSQTMVAGGGVPSLRGASYSPWEWRAVLERLGAAVGRWELGGREGRGRKGGHWKGGKRGGVEDEMLF